MIAQTALVFKQIVAVVLIIRLLAVVRTGIGVRGRASLVFIGQACYSGPKVNTILAENRL